jgi:lytic cellulose monooxygenase (C1-hydroxylating)
MPATIPTILRLLAAAGVVQAHGHVKRWKLPMGDFDGFDDGWKLGVDLDPSNAWGDWVSDDGYLLPTAYNTSHIACHINATNGALNNASIAAGETLTAVWNAWPETHHGPIVTYIAAADDPTTVDKTTLEWVKIQEGGYLYGETPGVWVSDKLIDNCYQNNITIPAALKPGKYVLRHELIALHSADQLNGAQNYPQCVSILSSISSIFCPMLTLA